MKPLSQILFGANWSRFITSPPLGVRSFAMSVSVCLPVRWHMSKTACADFPKFSLIIYLRAPKSWEVTSLICHTEPKTKKSNEEKSKWDYQKNCPSKSLWSQSWGQKEVYDEKDFVKEVGFEAGVKEWGSYGWWEWWVDSDRRCGRSRNRQVSDRETGMRLTERSRELIPETRWRILEVVISYW